MKNGNIFVFYTIAINLLYDLIIQVKRYIVQKIVLYYEILSYYIDNNTFYNIINIKK